MKRFLDLMPAVLVAAAILCSCPGPADIPAADQPSVQADTLPLVSRTTLYIDAAGQWTDIFLYSSRATKNLKMHTRIFCDSLSLPDSLLRDGEIIVGIGNGAATFNIQALSRYDSMESLCFRLEDEDPSRPLLSGFITAGEGNRLRLKPLMCLVRIRSVSNFRADGLVLSYPRVRLRGINHIAEVLRTDAFRPTETLDSRWVNLPTDIGQVTSYPGTVLFCYPSDAERDTPGTPWPTLEMEYIVFPADGVGQEDVCSAVFPVGRLPRGSEVFLDLEVR